MHPDDNCVFCGIVSGKIPCFKLFEDDRTLAFMDINPAHDGHCLVVSREHYANIFDISDDLLAAVARSTQKVANAVNHAISPEGLNLVQANGEGAQQSVKHLHFHVLPRKIGDQLKFDWGVKPGDRNTIAALAEKIRSFL